MFSSTTSRRSRVGRIVVELAVVALVVGLIFVAQDSVADVLATKDAFVWENYKQNTTAAPTAAPTGTLTVFFQLDFPGVGTVNQAQIIAFVAQLLGVNPAQIVITAIQSPIPAMMLAGQKLAVQQAAGSRVLFQANMLTAAQSAAALATVQNGCTGTLSTIGANCATLQQTTGTAPVPAPSEDDDVSAVVGGVVGGVGGCLCLVLLAAAAFFILKKQKQNQQPKNQFELGPGVGGPGPIDSPFGSTVGFGQGPPVGGFGPPPLGAGPYGAPPPVYV